MKATISRMKNSDEGFTLIELMIVIVVLGILAGIAIFGVSTFRDDATTASTNANTKICDTAKAAYLAKNGSAATTDAQLAPYLTTAPAGGCF